MFCGRLPAMRRATDECSSPATATTTAWRLFRKSLRDTARSAACPGHSIRNFLRRFPTVQIASSLGGLPVFVPFRFLRRSLARAIVLLKREPIEPFGNWFASRLGEVVGKEGERLAAEAIVPVPLPRPRSCERGFNQVDLCARPFSKRLHLPYQPVLLVRTQPRAEKQLLRSEERREAVRGAFARRRRGRVDNLRILLLDDVMTTGATLDACSRALREAGAKSVLGLTLARASRPLSSFAEHP